MSALKKQVLIIDDSPEDIQVLVENLKEEYAILVATDGQKGVEMAKREPRPDVILMDVEMPVMNGYETCKKLKDDSEHKNTNVIFVSAHDSTEEIIAGYEAGGSDYLVKPVKPEELLHKVKHAISSKDLIENTSKDSANAMQTAMTAMTSWGEQGLLIDFLRNSFSCKTAKDLARTIIAAVKGFSVECTVQIRTEGGMVNLSSGETVPPLEAELLYRLKDDKRIIEKGQRCIITYGSVSLLLKDMPEDDDKRGRYRDHLAMLVEGAESKMKAIQLSDILARVIVESNRALREIEAEQILHKEKSQRIMDGMLLGLESTFISWGLSEAQEKNLISLVQEGIDQSLDHLEEGFKVDDKFRQIVHRLTSAATFHR
ncbi:MAG: response regulator [Gammaproteobacteria bacterium]|nr:response regulator [Gammaproteobacteria bacterium]